MLSRLAVENYALIESLEIEFDRHLNIITGQTGAGKSVLLGALSLALGNRADTAVLSDAERNCVVEAQFDGVLPLVGAMLSANDIDEDDTLVIRRIITPSGRSRAYVNDVPVQLPFLRDLAVRLIDVHSQHQSLLLGEESFRIDALDSIAECLPLRREYEAAFAAMNSASRELESLRTSSERLRDEMDYITHQFGELSAMKLTEGETEELEESLSVMENAEEIRMALSECSAQLDAENGGVLVSLSRILHSLKNVRDCSRPCSELAERVSTCLVELKDISMQLPLEADRIDADPVRLDALRTRLDSINSLLRKHRVSSVRELIDIQQDYGRRISEFEDSDEHISALTGRLSALTAKASELASQLTEARMRASSRISNGVNSLLGRLAMSQSEFQCVISPCGLSSLGADRVEFLFSPVRGTAPRSLERIASGGEMSRVMLCLKALVGRDAQLPTIVFDEIDTGVSGKVADETGTIISELAESMQVINITHLPQVASKGHTHFRVFKDTRTHIARLSESERVDEIAAMISGDSVTAAAVQQARHLLGLPSMG